MRKIGEILQEARDEAGLSQRDLARLTGMTTGQLSQMENTIDDPRFSSIARYARGVGLSLDSLADWLLGAGSGSGKITVEASERERVAFLRDVELAKIEVERGLSHLNAILEQKKPRPKRKKRQKDQ